MKAVGENADVTCAGGLGDFIVRGLALNNSRLILLGAVPAAILALVLDYAIGTAERMLQPGTSGKGRKN